ncbi:5-bromo-4-chloroindolyl phosphate hydrolysis family protein [Calidifontibacillus erzurumensis]|uniref:5-bromo-4-chloroindolyl phosphate hydrolysis family protein n=1 Tax=Calidifontibacillus erzurumensis TaxID=2741433 RepID=A0A8J8GEL9_9BACI|nr:5-bromo-4-chloroindolyl phosphate hydrolysis family protein [Calidifontibacillus erzurumensis]NSL50988.1 5-bromo-4-chloroindolyl phosphate hydrolysis family protein [Calidifontibacillus erzurumensis]
MKTILSFIYRMMISSIVFVVTLPIAHFGLSMSIGVSSLIALISGATSYYFLKLRSKQKLLKDNHLTRKEYQSIERNLKEAKEKIKRLNKAMLGIRSFRAAKLIGSLQRIVKQIYQIVKNEPKRFYQAERFFFYHLDSVVEISERYVFLSRQNVKNVDVRLSLTETEETMENLLNLLNDDLLRVLANDIETLQLELDVAKQAHERHQTFMDMGQQSFQFEKSEEQKLLTNENPSIKINFTTRTNRDEELIRDERSHKS